MSLCRLFLLFFFAIIFSYLPAELLLCGAEEPYGIYHVVKNSCVLGSERKKRITDCHCQRHRCPQFCEEHYRNDNARADNNKIPNIPEPQLYRRPEIFGIDVYFHKYLQTKRRYALFSDISSLN